MINWAEKKRIVSELIIKQARENEKHSVKLQKEYNTLKNTFKDEIKTLKKQKATHKKNFTGRVDTDISPFLNILGGKGKNKGKGKGKSGDSNFLTAGVALGVLILGVLGYKNSKNEVL